MGTIQIIWIVYSAALVLAALSGFISNLGERKFNKPGALIRWIVYCVVFTFGGAFRVMGAAQILLLTVLLIDVFTTLRASGDETAADSDGIFVHFMLYNGALVCAEFFG